MTALVVSGIRVKRGRNSDKFPNGLTGQQLQAESAQDLLLWKSLPGIQCQLTGFPDASGEGQTGSNLETEECGKSVLTLTDTKWKGGEISAILIFRAVLDTKGA